MCTSSEIVVTLVAESVATNITLWAINPSSGQQPLQVEIDGFLFRNGINENQPDSAIVDGEVVYFQVWNTVDWAVAATIVTAYDSVRGFHGHIYSKFTFTKFPSGQWRTRLVYNGNPAKGLTGC